MEYIIVRFEPDDIRDVLVYGHPIGSTEQTLMLRAGYKAIKLSGAGYVPAVWSGNIGGTSAEVPKEIVFKKIGANPSPPVAPGAGQPLPSGIIV